ncbi:MAG: Tol-Pal system beta propeller repeat protein TolB, partial [bacterium]
NIEKITNLNSITLFPAVSPDNSILLFSSFFDKWMKLYMYELNEGKLELLAGYPGLNGPASFSPDGRHVALVLSKDGDADIFVMDIKKRKLERLTTERSIETSPCWSPTGNEIVFTSDRSGSPQIYIMDADGANVRRISWLQSSYNDQPSWNPRGDKIAFASMIREQFDIVVVDVLGENPVVLTSTGNNQNPAWSPDGYHIVFSSNRDGNYKLYTMSWYGTEIAPITNGEDYSPFWSARYNWNFEK